MRTATDRNGGRYRSYRDRAAARALRRCARVRHAIRAILRAIPDWMFLTTVEGVLLDYHARDTSSLHAPPLGIPWKEHQRGAAFARCRDAERRPLRARAHRTSPRNSNTRWGPTIASASTRRASSAVTATRFSASSGTSPIASRRRLEADAQRRELAHLSRVAMLGELSGALAHELSQPLTAVLSNAQAARHLLNRQPLESRSCWASRSTTSSGATSGPERSSIACARC